LKLSNNDITDPTIYEEMKVGLNNSNLRVIDLSENAIGDVSIKSICKSLNLLCCIEKLNMTNVKMTWKGAKDIFLAVKGYPLLKELILDRNHLDGSKLKILKDMIGLSRSKGNKGLQVLHMNQCQLGEEAAFHIAAGLSSNMNLKQLYLAENNFGDEGALEFAEALLIEEEIFKVKVL
jgi:Ran GTPase-activating protein (RanGAP) involved in mRNA processing and transport